MASERLQRRTERLLDQIDAAEASGDWQQVHDLAQDVLDLDEDNSEARAYLRASERRLGAPSQSGAGTELSSSRSRRCRNHRWSWRWGY